MWRVEAALTARTAGQPYPREECSVGEVGQWPGSGCQPSWTTAASGPTGRRRRSRDEGCGCRGRSAAWRARNRPTPRKRGSAGDNGSARAARCASTARPPRRVPGRPPSRRMVLAGSSEHPSRAVGTGALFRGPRLPGHSSAGVMRRPVRCVGRIDTHISRAPPGHGVVWACSVSLRTVSGSVTTLAGPTARTLQPWLRASSM